MTGAQCSSVVDLTTFRHNGPYQYNVDEESNRAVCMQRREANV
jgi:hypothetical protein